MRALIYDPYLDTLGGGERYCLSVAEFLLSCNWQVDLVWDDKTIVKKLIDRLNLKIKDISLLGVKLNQLSFFQKIKLMRQYDLIFWLSDGSVPLMFGKNNILHFQVPFYCANKNWLLNKIKFLKINTVVCNSLFTKKFIDKEFKINSQVLYPPVDIDQFKPGKKSNIIIAVGRFEQSMQAKRQDVLITAFKQMVDEGLADWQLVLIGGSLKRKQNPFLKQLVTQAKGYPIKFLVNAPFSTLRRFYSKSKIFWHAAGFEIDDRRQPHQVEHFGITPVEAMAAGCVPVVMDKGGLKEIVRRGVGERWITIKDLKTKTKKIIKNEKLYDQYQQASLARAKQFSKNKFFLQLQKLL